MAVDELDRAQTSLERALAKSRAGEDRALMAAIRERGEQFANLLNGVIRMAHIHSADNHAFDQPIVDLKRALDALRQVLGRVHLVTVEDQTYLNDVRLKAQTGTGPQRHLGAELQRHNVGGLSFLSELSTDDLRALVALVGARAAASQPRTALISALAERGITSVELQGIFHFKLGGAEPVTAALTTGEGRVAAPEGQPVSPPSAGLASTPALSLARRIASLVEETWDNVATGRQLNLLGLRRLVVELQQFGADREELWLLTHDGFSTHGWHALRMAQGALLVTQALGLPEGLQQDYGLAALTHDVGYAVPLPQAQALHSHGVAGVLALLRQTGFHEAKIRRLFGALQHHADLNVVVAGKTDRPPLIARVLRVLEDYEAMTRARPVGTLSPPEALARLAGGAGTLYDPVIVQLVINRLGQFPPGTLLGLDDGRVVRSVSCARSTQTFATPRAQVVMLAGNVPAGGQLIDLATEGKVRGSLRAR